MNSVAFPLQNAFRPSRCPALKKVRSYPLPVASYPVRVTKLPKSDGLLGKLKSCWFSRVHIRMQVKDAGLRVIRIELNVITPRVADAIVRFVPKEKNNLDT